METIEFIQNEWNINETSITPLGAGMLALAVLLVFIFPLRHVPIPLLIIACFVSCAQRITIFGLDFTLLRVLILACASRIFLRNEYSGFKINSYDIVLLVWLVCKAVVYTIHNGTVSAAVNQMGAIFESLGFYLVFRVVVHSKEDFLNVMKILAVISVPVCLTILLEWMTGHNLFSYFGGVSEITKIREGRLRCQGPFSHPIMMGAFWVTVLVLLQPLWMRSLNMRKFAAIGTICSMIMVFAAASSTPIIAMVSAIVGFSLYFIRRSISLLLIVVTVAGVMLHIVMKAPVWHLIARVGVVGGSTGYHRFALLDAFIVNAQDWILTGISDTGQWGHGLSDVTNQFILEGVRGGGAGLFFFLLLLGMLFHGLNCQCSLRQDRLERVLCWSLWVALFVQCFIFFSASYFGQIFLLWNMLLALAANWAVDLKAVPAIPRQPESTPLAEKQHSPWKTKSTSVVANRVTSWITRPRER